MVASCDVPQRWTESNSKLAPFFTKVRDNAHNIRTVLKNGWHCSCSSAHKAMLQLERRIDDRESEFSVMLAIPSVPALESSKTATPEVYIQQETRIAISTVEAEREEEEEKGGEDFLAAPQRGSASCSASSDNDKPGHHTARLSTILDSKSDDDRQGKCKWAAIQAWKPRMKSFR